jgi:hypothetical protein
MMIEVLASILSGAAAGPDRHVFQSQQLIAYDIDAFTGLEKFRSDMDMYLAKLRTGTGARARDGEENVTRRYAAMLTVAPNGSEPGDIKVSAGFDNSLGYQQVVVVVAA